MIAVSESLEYIPRGRQAVDEHPGPTEIKQHPQLPSENLLLLRLQNVNISAKEEHNEFWCVREIYEDFSQNKRNGNNKSQGGGNKGQGFGNNLNRNSDAKSNGENNPKTTGPSEYMCEYLVNSEEELYVKKHTAVWTRGKEQRNVKTNLNINLYSSLGISDERCTLPRLCFTCETPIKFAFFCNKSFISSPKEQLAEEETGQKVTSICLIGNVLNSDTLRNI